MTSSRAPRKHSGSGPGGWGCPAAYLCTPCVRLQARSAAILALHLMAQVSRISGQLAPSTMGSRPVSLDTRSCQQCWTVDAPKMAFFGSSHTRRGRYPDGRLRIRAVSQSSTQARDLSFLRTFAACVLCKLLDCFVPRAQGGQP